jgi:hypothetical protein
LNISRKSAEKIQISLKSDKNNGILPEDQYTFMNISHSVLLRMRNISGKRCRENQNTHFTLRNFFFFENRAIYVMTWKNMVDPGRPQMAIWHMRNACWIPKAINIHYEYVLLIAFPLQQWLHERASML